MSGVVPHGTLTATVAAPATKSVGSCTSTRPYDAASIGAGLPLISTDTPARVVGPGELVACLVASPRPDPRIDIAEPGAIGPTARLAAFTTPLSLITGLPPDAIFTTYASPVP